MPRARTPVRRRVAPAILIAALASGVFAQPARVIDLATFGTPAGELTRIFGSSQVVGGAPASGAFGVPVAGGGDLDDDGFEDFVFSSVVAAPLGRVGAGEMIVVFGDGTFGGTLTTAGFGDNRLKIAGQHTEEVAGVEVEIADVTGDGVGDLLIGRQNHTPEMGRPGAGALTILVGGPELRDHAEGGTYLDLGAIPAALTVTTFIGAASYDRLGIWMRAGDVDGDGIKDIAVGADEVDATVDVTQNSGAVFVLRGGSHLAADQTVDLADFGTMDFPGTLAAHVAKIKPPTGSNKFHFGATCQIGDLDGDDKGEVIGAAALNRSSAGLRLTGAPAGTGEAGGGAPQGDVFIAWGDLFPSTDWASGYTIDLGTSMFVTRIRGSASNPGERRAGRRAPRRSRLRRRRRQRPLPRRSRWRRRQRLGVGNRARDLRGRRAGRHGRDHRRAHRLAAARGAPHHDPRPRADRHRRRHRGPRRLRRRRLGGPRVLQPVRRAAEPRTEPDRCT